MGEQFFLKVWHLLMIEWLLGHVIGEGGTNIIYGGCYLSAIMHKKIGIWAQKVEKVNFHLVKMAPKGVIEKNEKVLKTPLSTHIS